MNKNELLEMQAAYKQLEATERRAADLQAQLDAANFRADNECKLANKWEGENRALQEQLDAANAKADHEHELHLKAMERNRKLQDEVEIAKHETQAVIEVVRQLRNVKNGDAVMYSSISASAMQEATRQIKQLRDENQQLRAVVAAAGELLAKSVVETESNRWQFSIHAGAWTKLVDALRALNGHGEAG